MAIPFGIYNLGNSGGSWIQSVIRSKQRCYAWEEVRRNLNLPIPGDGMTGEEIQAQIFAFFKEQCERDDLLSCGLIKGFRLDIAEFISSIGGRFLQHVRHPIRHLHGTRKRAKGAENGLGRKPENKREYFLGRVLWQSSRYRKYLRRADAVPLIRLEDLAQSLNRDCLYFRQVLSYITQVEWTAADAVYVRTYVPPRNRTHLQREDWFVPHIGSKNDPPARDIWQEWEPWQRETFLQHYETIMLSLGYSVPEV